MKDHENLVFSDRTSEIHWKHTFSAGTEIYILKKYLFKNCLQDIPPMYSNEKK